MFGIERLEKIKEILLKEKSINVSELSELFNVTEMTIRRDLDKLQETGFIIKTHGGALLNQNMENGADNKPGMLGEIRNEKSKQQISEIAAYMANEYDSIFLGSGSTCTLIAKAICNKSFINIITNNLNILNVIPRNNSINVVYTGGSLSLKHMALYGDMAINSLKGLYIDKAFLSVSGIDMQHGFTLTSHEQLNLFKTITSITKELIIVGDSSKFDKVSFVKYAPLNAVNKVITNEDIPYGYKEYFFKNGVQIFTSYEALKSD